MLPSGKKFSMLPAKANLMTPVKHKPSNTASDDSYVMAAPSKVEQKVETRKRSSSQPPPISNSNQFYVCPSNTIVASDGQVYEVEPYQLPPPSEIASLFQQYWAMSVQKSVKGIKSIYPTGREHRIKTSPSISPGITPPMSPNRNRKKPPEVVDLTSKLHGEAILDARKKVVDLSVNTIPLSPRSTPCVSPKTEKGKHSAQSTGATPVNHLQSKFSMEKFSIWDYTVVEVLGLKDTDISHQKESKSSSKIFNFMMVPVVLESFVGFGLFVCLDAFLFVVCYLPVRVAVAFVLLILEAYQLVKASFFNYITTETGETSKRQRFFHRSNMYDMMFGLLIVISCVVLQQFDMSRTYHFIRGQTIIKLYVLTSMLEVLERMLCSFGQDAFDAMFAKTCGNITSYKNFFVAILLYLVFAVYVVVHASFYFLHVATITVALNTSDQALITLLVVNNFAELKTSVFKKFDQQLLFQLVCADVTERFQIFLFLFSIIIVAASQAAPDATWSDIMQPFSLPVMMMFGGEMVADWIKHAFITKFNRIDASVYQDYSRVLREDILQCQREKMDNDHSNTYAITKRVGFSQIPLACVFIRYIFLALSSKRCQTYLASVSSLQLFVQAFLFFALLVGIKSILGISLIFYSGYIHNHEVEVAAGVAGTSDSESQKGDAGAEAVMTQEKMKQMKRLRGQLANAEKFIVYKGKMF